MKTWYILGFFLKKYIYARTGKFFSVDLKNDFQSHRNNNEKSYLVFKCKEI